MTDKQLWHEIQRQGFSEMVKRDKELQLFLREALNHFTVKGIRITRK